MRKLFITLVSCLIVGVSFGQKTDIVYAIDALDFYSKRQFQDLKDKKLSTDSNETYIQTTYSSKLIINGAKSCSIREKLSVNRKKNFIEPEFVAWYGDFKTLEDAYKKADVIASQINQNNKGFKLEETDQFLTGYKIRVIVKNLKDKIKIYNAKIDINENKVTHVFSVTLSFTSDAESKEYTLINIDQNDEEICKQIRQIVACSDKNFAKLKGEQIISGSKPDFFESLSPKHKSTLQLQGSRNCFIESNTMTSTFVVETANKLNKENANKMLQQLFQTVAYSLGKGYAYWIAPDNSSVEFVKLQRYSYKYRLMTVAQIEMKLQNDLFDSSIYFYQPHKVYSK